MDAVQRLLAIEEIKRLKARYFRTMDTKDWDGFRTLFTDDVEVDASEAFFPADHRGAPIETDLVRPQPDPSLRVKGLDRFMELQHRYLAGVSTVHHGHTPEIDVISADEATGVWAMEDKLRYPRRSRMREMHGYGHYRERYRREGDAWKIAALKLTRVRVDVMAG
jgi:hypothetical protein